MTGFDGVVGARNRGVVLWLGILLGAGTNFAFASGISGQDEAAIADAEETVNPESGEGSAGMYATIEEVVVTGTHIRSAAPSSSPVQIYGQDEIGLSGASTTQDFIQSLSQNFAGGSNDALVRGTPYDSASSNNISMGSSVNLRGLGSGATLVLLNGQRLAPSSAIGDFVDISLIPLSAIKRVEVLTDGASSIYGGDAVAGVVNFVLRERYEGVESFAGYGGATDGGAAEYRAGVTGGTAWGSGNLLATYEYYKRDNLSVLDKEFSEPIGLDIDLLPGQERHSMLLSGSQAVNSNVEVFGRGIYSRRDGFVTRANTITQPTRTTRSETEQYSLISGVSAEVFADWNLEVTGVYSNVSAYSFTPTVGTVPGPERTVNSDQWSIETKLSGGVLSLPAGQVKVAFGGAYREEAFDSFNFVTDVRDRDISRRVSAGFAELLVPIIGPDQNVPGVESLDLNVSGRTENYDDFGTTSNPKIGLAWVPFDGLKLRGTYGTSFNPPDLGRVGATDTEAYIFTNDILNALLTQNPEIPNSAPALLVLGTNDLEPETATSWTLGADLAADLGAGNLSASFTFYGIEFEDRIKVVQVPGGAFNVYNIGLCCPELLPHGTVVIDPDEAQVQEIITEAINEEGFYDQFGLYNGDPSSIGLIGNLKLTNLAETETRGLDLNLDYAMETGFGDLAFLLNGTYIFDFKNQNSSTTPLVEQVDTLFRPADFKLRAGTALKSGNWSAGFFVNYVDGYTDDRPEPRLPVPSWTTIDVNVGYSTERGATETWSDGLRFDINVSNVLNDEPPFIGNDFMFGILGYDPANANALGRFVNLRLTKAF